MFSRTWKQGAFLQTFSFSVPLKMSVYPIFGMTEWRGIWIFKQNPPPPPPPKKKKNERKKEKTRNPFPSTPHFSLILVNILQIHVSSFHTNNIIYMCMMHMALSVYLFV